MITNFSLYHISDTANPIPFNKRSISQNSIIHGFHHVPSQTKQVIHNTMTSKKSLGVMLRFKPPHLSFLLPGVKVHIGCFHIAQLNAQYWALLPSLQQNNYSI